MGRHLTVSIGEFAPLAYFKDDGVTFTGMSVDIINYLQAF
jgi:hypothetical protein